jgi:hypothetical protein
MGGFSCSAQHPEDLVPLVFLENLNALSGLSLKASTIEVKL